MKQFVFSLCLGTIVAVFLSFSSVHVVMASELIGHWEFDETSGSAVDSTGNHADLTNNNGVTYGAGKYGNAGYFNGTNQYFSGVGPNLSGQSFTFSAWLWRDSDATNDRIYFSLGDTNGGNNHNMHLRVTDDGLMRFGFLNNDLDAPSGTFVEGQWNHVVLTYDTNNNERKIYLNGGVAKASDISGSDFLGDTLLNIGRWSNGFQYWDGRIDDLKIYNRALTENEVNGIAEGGAGPGILSVDTLSPADNDDDVSPSSDLVLTFSTSTVATSTGSIVIYQTSDNAVVETIPVSDARITKSGAVITINPTTDLNESTEYYVWIPDTAFEDANNVFYEGTTASSSWSFTTGDFNSPTPSSINAVSSTTAVTITWSTSENASSWIVYGPSTSYGSTTPEIDTSPRVTSHEVSVSDLLECTTYHYRVIGTDGASNTATSSDQSFTTEGCEGDAVPDVVVTEDIVSNTGGSAEITDDGKTFTVTAPSNATATSSSFVIQIKSIASESVLAALGRPNTTPNEVGTTLFDVKAIINGDTILDSFDAEVTITYEYTNEEVSGLDESSLWLYHYTNGAWVRLNDCALTVSSNTITCTTPSFSVFGLFGNEAEASSGGGGSSTHFACRDSTATNYKSSGRHKESLCIYDIQEPIVPTSVCEQYITSYIRYGAENNSDAVRKLEIFLNEKQHEALPVDGVYSLEDVEAVKRFQARYASEVLGVWGITEPTGYVYRTTLMKINSFYCNASISCPAFTEYNNLNENTVSPEVAKTKVLLSELGFYDGELNDIFDMTLKISLKNFQETFSDTMLDPWGIAYGTGYKYKTTNKFLNMLVGCETPAIELDGQGTFDY